MSTTFSKPRCARCLRVPPDTCRGAQHGNKGCFLNNGALEAPPRAPEPPEPMDWDEMSHTIREAGRIQRYHTADLTRAQSNAEHTYNVLALVLAIEPDARRELLLAALLHDVAELRTGDVPSPTKWAYPEIEAALKQVEQDMHAALRYPALTDRERFVLKMADLLEGAMFCAELYTRGDTKAYDISRRFLEAFAGRGGWEDERARRIGHHITALLRAPKTRE